MMLASAKADLLRREDYASYPNFAQRAHSNSQGHLWSPNSRPGSVSTTGSISVDPLDNVSSLASSLQSTLSFDTQSSRASSVSPTGESVGYVSPVPHWAVNNNNTIPPGYVSHARDACVDIDYQWDSMRSPLDWGDGGSYPEEWTEMHRRFRKGVQHLIDWYSSAEKPTDMVTKMASRFARRTPIDVMGDFTVDEDVETEAIVILVSHGAGCNALIGAITHQPVLVDVAMASLTMAVRKPTEERQADWSAAHHPRGWASPERTQDSIPIHHLYDLKIFASTDHLRSPPTTPSASRTPSVASVLNGARGRPAHSVSFASSLNTFSVSDGAASRNSSANAALSSLRRGEGPPQYPSSKLQFLSSTNGGLSGGITVGSGVTSFGSAKPSTLSRTPSVGLWSPIAREEEADDDDDDDGMVLNFSHEKLPVAHVDITPQIVTPRPVKLDSYFDLPPSSTSDTAAETPKDAMGLPDTPESGSGTAVAGGLWGSTPMPPDEADAMRDMSSTKRRWTVTERN